MSMLNLKNHAALAVLGAFSICALISGCSSQTNVPDRLIGGTVTGLSNGNTVVLGRSGAVVDTITISANGTYSFPQPLAEGESEYSVILVTQPGNQYCSLANGSGAAYWGDVSNVNVFCGNKPTAAASMTGPRIEHTATLLANGKVLAVGGRLANMYALFSSELYDPATDTWAAAANLTGGRYGHTANLLANGQVLVAGGSDSALGAVNTAVLYDPVANTWTPTASMASARRGHFSVVLADGRVLVVGGVDAAYTAVAAAEIYDPATGLWASAGSLTLNIANSVRSAALLANGKVLVTKGQSATASTTGAAEIYDPASNSWSATPEAPKFTGPAVSLSNGDALVLSDVEYLIYATATNTWTRSSYTAANNPLTGQSSPYNYNQPIGLADGTVLIPGAISTNSQLQSHYFYNAADSAWYQGPNLLTPREKPTATQLPNGRVLIAGGSSLANDGTYGTILSTAEQY